TLLMMELRAIPELFGLSMSWPALTAMAPRGDRQPVLVLPGLITSDRATRPMRAWLRTLGYRAHGWEMGRNFGPVPGVEEGLIARLESLAERYGRKVSLVGWSLGGIYARQLAKMRPSLVRQVISLGSPFNGDPRATNAWRVYQMASGQSVDEGERHMGGAIRTPPPVPSTAIYSRTDGICAWQSCIEDDADQTENVEVLASHCGLGHHPAALFAVADRLSQPEDAWSPFDRGGARGLVYPEPARREAAVAV
ncbi:MAG: alpha/beta hydrolase, partial [Pseudomonadota bacterium]